MFASKDVQVMMRVWVRMELVGLVIIISAIKNKCESGEKWSSKGLRRIEVDCVCDELGNVRGNNGDTRRNS